MNPPNILFLGTYDDKPYLSYLKGCVGNAKVSLSIEPIQTVTEVIVTCKQRNITGVISTNRTLLTKLLGAEGERKSPSLDNYTGSFFTRDGIDIVFIDPLEHFIKVTYGKFLTKRFISKLVNPEVWQLTEGIGFSWSIIKPENAAEVERKLSEADFIAVDIETFKVNLAIRCIGYTAVKFISSNSSSISTSSFVLPVDDSFALSLMRKLNAIPVPKVTQNGKYDNAYLARYNAPLHSWFWDTATMFHCWYSELPKDLAFLGSFFVRRAMYWKDLANTSDLEQYYEYNCRDHWTTALVMIEWMMQAPQWAKDNYLMEFPVNFPAHYCELIGIKRDQEKLVEARGVADTKIAEKVTSLQHMVGYPINTNSTPQVQLLCKILGLGEVKSTKESELKKFMYTHPLNGLLLGAVLDIRGERKLTSTYLRLDSDANAKNKYNGASEYRGRILYSINPHGTDTGRNNSQESHFWCGMPIQVIPRGDSVKQTFQSDDGFRFGEADLKQAESRDTANISGDARLLAAVSGEKDFHSINASTFFGYPYETIFDDTTQKTKNKKLRDLAKRVNHGANYCMGAGVLVDTMGLNEIEEARKLLGLSKLWTHLQIAEHLLKCFHTTYPGLQGVMYPAIWADVRDKKLLVGATGWTRYCFGDVDKSKRDRNGYVAHVPQSLNAMVVNKAFIKVFHEIQMSPVHNSNFKLLAQIHDSILFQFRVGHEYLCEMVQERMELPVTVKSYDGVTRTFTVPADIKAGADGKGALYWNQTE